MDGFITSFAFLGVPTIILAGFIVYSLRTVAGELLLCGGFDSLD